MSMRQRALSVNPFAERDNYDRSSLVAYRSLTLLSWLLAITLSYAYTIQDSNGPRTIQAQNQANPTFFALDPHIIAASWIVLLVSQTAYLCLMFGSIPEDITIAANVGTQFIVHNVCTSILILLWVYSRFFLAEVVVCLDLWNLTSSYLRHDRSRFFVHVPVVAAPLAWNIMILFTNGAVAVNEQSTGALIAANIALWAIFVYILSLQLLLNDAAVGAAMAVLMTAIGVHQLHIGLSLLQAIFAFVIAAMLVLSTLLISLLRLYGCRIQFSGAEDDGGNDMLSDEARPLLDDE